MLSPNDSTILSNTDRLIIRNPVPICFKANNPRLSGGGRSGNALHSHLFFPCAFLQYNPPTMSTSSEISFSTCDDVKIRSASMLRKCVQSLSKKSLAELLRPSTMYGSMYWSTAMSYLRHLNRSSVPGRYWLCLTPCVVDNTPNS